jgi:hypothetical protein
LNRIILVVERPGHKLFQVEIRSVGHVDEVEIRGVNKTGKALGAAECLILAQSSLASKAGEVAAPPWQEGTERLFERR